MARVKRAINAKKKHKKILKQAKGYFGAKSKLFRPANQAVMKSLNYAYIGRKQRKRDFRSLIPRSREGGSSLRRIPNFLAARLENSPMLPNGQMDPQKTLPNSSVRTATMTNSTRELGAVRLSHSPDVSHA